MDAAASSTAHSWQKMLLSTHRRLRPWMIPLVGGVVFFSLVHVWLTSALCFFRTTGLVL